MSFQLQDDQMVELSVEFQSAGGNPAEVEGAPTWSSSDDSLLVVNASADGMSATATTVGPLGTAQVQLTADADLGDGVVEIQGILDVEIVASAAVTAVITPGHPEPSGPVINPLDDE